MLFESLDPRRLFASIAGTIFNDVDTSTGFDPREGGIRGVQVFLDANANGRLDTGEVSTKTDASGQYTFKDVTGDDVNVGVVPPAGLGQTSPGPLGATKGGFDITLAGLTGLDAPVRRAFEEAARRWESIIVGDLPDVGATDDVRISVSVRNIDGRSGTLAQSGPTRTRFIGDLPYAGEMQFDSADIGALMDEGHFVDTVVHEMAHVLGFGTIWDQRGLLAGEGTRQARFLGRRATAEYNALFDKDASAVPLENTGGSGTRDSHWPEAPEADAFNTELMTGFTEAKGVAEPLSRVTVAQFADLGYDVNMDAADAWQPTGNVVDVTTPLDLGARAYEWHVTDDQDDLNFGYRADTAPTIGTLTATTAVLGKPVTLSAGRLRDAEGDAIAGVSFYGESNGRAGLQTGRGGDAYLGADDTADDGVWAATVPTAALAAGTQTYYAVATDALGLSGRRSANGTLQLPPPPTRPNPVVTVKQSNSSATLFWRDRSGDEIGFRIELLDASNTLIKSVNVPANTGSYVIAGLTHGTIYNARVRSYGYGGASPYTRADRFRV